MSQISDPTDPRPAARPSVPTNSGDAVSLESQVAELQRKIDSLEQARADEVTKKEREQTKKLADEAAKTLEEEKQANNSWRVKLGGHIQMDYTRLLKN